MDIISAKLGANMAKADLEHSGQVGYEEPAVFEKAFECTVPADGSTVSIAGPFTFKGENYERFVTVTVDGESYDCYIRLFNQGDDAEIEPVSGSMPCKITGYCGANYTSTYTVVRNLEVRYKTAHDADGHVIVESPIKEATIHPIDPKYLPSDTLYITLKSYGTETNPELDALYQALKERKPVNPIFEIGGNCSTKWELLNSQNRFAVYFTAYGDIHATLYNGTWTYGNP